MQSRPVPSLASRPIAIPRQCPGVPGSALNVTPEHALVSQASRSPSHRSASPSPRRSRLQVWLTDVTALHDQVRQLDDCIHAVRRDRKLGEQVRRVIAIEPCARGDGLGAAVLRDNRLVAWMEHSLVDEHNRLVGELECTRDILTPLDLLQQAQQEWDDLPLQPVDPSDESAMAGRLRADREALVGRLGELVDVLHPGVPMPAVQRWIGQRLADLALLAASDAGPAST